MIADSDDQSSPKDRHFSNDFYICSWNVQHLSNKIDQIRLLLNFVTACDLYSHDVLCITESFLGEHSSSSEFNIDNYNLERKDRVDKAGGGLVTYIRSHICYVRRFDLESVQLEIMWIEIKPYKRTSFLIGSVYRPPSSTFDVDLSIIQNIEKAFLEGKEMVMCGDFNVDLLSERGSDHFVYNSLISVDMVQLVNGITRPASNACLDHIYVTNPEHFTKCCISDVSLSDHCPVYTCRKLCGLSKNSDVHIQVRYRSFKDFDEKNFLHDLRNAPWYLLNSEKEVENAFEKWVRIFNEVCDSNCPVIERRVKRLKQPAWLTSDIIDAMKKRDLSLKYAKANSCQSSWSDYKRNRNNVVHLIVKAKKRYFGNMLIDNKSKPSAIWNVYNSIINSNKSTNPTFIKDDVKYSNHGDISNEFNRVFTQTFNDVPIASDTYKNDRLQDFVRDLMANMPSFEFPPLTREFVYRSLLTAKSTGADNVNCKLLKIGASIISDILTYLFNMSLQQSVFPKGFKCARVVPLYKGSGNISELSNYRAISVLPALSKILERHIFNCLYRYFSCTGLLLENQSGFRRNFSCQTALLRLTDEILSNIDNGFLNSVLLLDLSKAFDLISLLSKLSTYGLSKSVIEWFKSYLSNRQQFVSYMGCNSDRSIVTRGVPQGSILGPLLFLIFINDLPLSVNRSSLHMYADDQTLITKGKNLNEINTTVNSDIAPISNWMISNSMRVNTTKTKYVLIATPQKLKSIANNRNDDLLSVYIAGSKISQVNCGSILGVSLDETLSWNSHVNRLCLTLSKRIGLIRRLRQFIPKQNRIVLYYGLIQSSLDYCIIVWGNTTECNIDKVFTLQKRLLRVLFELPYDFPSADLFNMFEVMSVRQRIFLFFSYKCFQLFFSDCSSLSK